MILALSVMSATARAIFYLIAVMLFIVAALVPAASVGDPPAPRALRFNLIAAGLALFVFPTMWDAFALS